MLRMYAKIKNPTMLQHFRGISLLSVLAKWYIGCLIIVAKKPTPLLCWGSVNVVGFEPGLSTDLILAPLMVVKDRAREWHSTKRVLVYKGDIYRAFDHMTPYLIAKVVEAGKTHPKLISAIVEENSNIRWSEKSPFRKLNVSVHSCLPDTV